METVGDLARALQGLKHRRAHLLRAIAARGQEADDVGDGLHAAIVLKEFAAHAQAGALFRKLSARFAQDPAVAYEHVQFHRRVGNSEEADRLLGAAIGRGAVNDGLIADLVLAMWLDPARSNIKRPVGQGLLRAALDAACSPYLDAVARHYRRRAPHYRQVIADAADTGTLTPWSAYRLAAVAIRRRAPFCLVRLGDGEGAFLDEPDVPACENAMVRAHRSHWCDRWFGDRARWNDPGLTRAANTLASGLGVADIVGVPDAGWIDHERRGRNIRALTGCLNARHAAQSRRPAGTSIGSTTLPIDLLARQMIAALLRQARRVDLVTCHADLAGGIERTLGVAVRRATIIAPPACDARDAAMGDGTDPLARDAALAHAESAVSAVGAGDVVLIGAGFLGKHLAARVKECGGIGLDVGSMLDLLAGSRTRPGFEGMEHLMLDRARAMA